jgi:phosphonate metabolism-associated iron-containing alcohol dehydrogenase
MTEIKLMETHMRATHLNSWSFYNPVKIHFGTKSRTILKNELAGQKLLVVTTMRGREQFKADPILGALQAEIVWVVSVNSNPSLTETQIEINRLVGQNFDAVVAFGGGSAMDVAKALAAALTPGLRCRDLATLIAQPELHLDRPLLTIHAVTTTSGTGSEVTPFATIWDHENRKKLSLTSDFLFPTTAIVDPELTYDLPLAVTLSTSLDAMNQAFESVWNRNRNPVTTRLAARAIELSFEAIPQLAADIDNHTARALIAEASLLAGLCISQTRTAICHSISYPLTAHFGLTHGMACAFTMGAVADLVLENAPESLAEIAALNGLKTAEALIAQLHSLLYEINLSSQCHATLPSTKALLELRGEMHTIGRADNFILEVSNETLKYVLDRS